MTEATEITTADMVRCAKRELKLRERLYPGWIKREKINAEVAEHELAAMRAIVTRLEADLAAEARR